MNHSLYLKLTKKINSIIHLENFRMKLNNLKTRLTANLNLYCIPRGYLDNKKVKSKK